MAQVLHGLLYLHEQGVIHRDIKGANILTTKQGLVKLADFGVASRTTGLHESSVVGTPYWMAPEVIELSGASTASDIWSLGCTVIELLEGKPPYYKLQPMPALFRIVNDDHPPLPQGASPVSEIYIQSPISMLICFQVVRDFLMQCFQKDPNLRVSARKLLKHPWIVSARRSDSVIPKESTKYEEAVKSVQEWNEALKSPNAGSFKKSSRPTSGSPMPMRKELPQLKTVAKEVPAMPRPKNNAEKFRSPETAADDNWDDDFASAISPSALKLPHLRPHDNFGGMLSSEKLKAFASFESVTEQDTLDLSAEAELTLKSPVQPTQTDLVQTIRPIQSKKAQLEKNGTKSPEKTKPRKSSARVAKPRPTSRGQSQPLRPISQPRPPIFYRESSIEDYSDLIAANDAVLERKLGIVTVRPCSTQRRHSINPFFRVRKCRHLKPSDLQARKAS
jgi:serine/threonine protein kinase